MTSQKYAKGTAFLVCGTYQGGYDAGGKRWQKDLTLCRAADGEAFFILGIYASEPYHGKYKDPENILSSVEFRN